MSDDTYEAPEHGWVCFHCGEHFPNTPAGRLAASEHFGGYVDAIPGCRLRMRAGERSLLRRIRWLEKEWRELNARVVFEDTDKDRQMAAMASDHGAALRREEEKGYARGVLDMMCSDCPPPDYPTDETRCAECPRRRFEEPQSMTKPILCVDFDGVIHSYSSGWQGADIISDPPVPGALEWLWRATNWFDVQVYSSRSKQLGGCAAMLEWMQSHARMEWEAPHVMRGDVSGLQYPITFCHEKPAAFLTIDDRAICFDGNWPALDPEALLKFRPWNKRETTGAAVSEIETLRAQLAAALAAMQELVNYDNGGSGDGGAILGAAEKILASHKDGKVE